MSEPVSALVARHPFLAGLAPAQLEAIARATREARFAPNELLLREGEGATRTFLIVSGSVSLEIHAHGRPLSILTVDGGEIVGWSWLVSPSRWHFDARAKDEVHALVLDGEALLDACDRDPALGYALLRRFMKVLTQRLEAVRVQLLDVYCPHGAELPWT